MKSQIYKIFFILILGLKANAQTPISLEDAYQRALGNNLDTKKAVFQAEFQDKIKRTGVVIDPLNITGELGEYNSKDFDNRFSVSQTFRLPGYYKKQNQVLAEQAKAAHIAVNLQKWQIKKELNLVFNQLHYIDAREILFKKIDSIYSEYLNRAQLRLKKGESNLLEKTTAENLKLQAGIQLNNLKKEREIALQQLDFLINDGGHYINQKQKFEVNKISSIGQMADNHWVIAQTRQQEVIENYALLAEKSKLLPSFSLGYSNTSMVRDYGSSRLHSGLVGLNIPLFNTGQKAVIEGQKINQKIAQVNKEIAMRNLKKQWNDLNRNYEKVKSEIDHYETQGLKNSEAIIRIANRQFYGGEINFLDWSILINQALDVENQYINKIKEYNDLIIELNSLSNIETN